jgi:hypothetical protein
LPGAFWNLTKTPNDSPEQRPRTKAHDVILSEVSSANEVEGSRTASRKRSRYRFLVREALPQAAQSEKSGQENWLLRPKNKIKKVVPLSDVQESLN